MSPQFSPVQTRIMKVLSDRFPHKIGQLQACLDDELGSATNTGPHLTAMRKLLRMQGEDIISMAIQGVVFYQLVKLEHLPDTVKAELNGP